MSRYRKVDTRIWGDANFRAFSSDAKLVFLMLLTHPMMTSIGAMRGNLAGLAADLGWPVERFAKGFGEPLAKCMVKYDDGCSFVWLTNFLRYNPPENPNVVKSMVGLLDDLPECPLRDELIQALRDSRQRYGEWFRERLPEPSTEPTRNGMPNPEPEPEPEPKRLVMKGARESGAEPPDPTPPDPADPPPVEPDPPEPPEKPVRVAPTPESIELARRFADALVAVKPDLKLPTNLHRWANSFRLMVERDGRTRERIERMIAYLPTDEFWRTVILSADTFREKFDKLELAASRPAFLGPKPVTAAARSFASVEEAFGKKA